jgi:hypothetical protein
MGDMLGFVSTTFRKLLSGWQSQGELDRRNTRVRQECEKHMELVKLTVKRLLENLGVVE